MQAVVKGEELGKTKEELAKLMENRVFQYNCAGKSLYEYGYYTRQYSYYLGGKRDVYFLTADGTITGFFNISSYRGHELIRNRKRLHEFAIEELQDYAHGCKHRLFTVWKPKEPKPKKKREPRPQDVVTNRDSGSRKELVLGSTGCGKTYYAINEAKRLGRFAYLAPCCQLVYETAIKYGNFGDVVSTGECHIRGTDNLFAVYETNIDWDAFDVIIIDEAHFVNDEERGGVLNKVIRNYRGHIFLMTATQTFFAVRGYKRLTLPSRQKFIREKVGIREYDARRDAGVPTIKFNRYKKSYSVYTDNILDADTPADRRLQLQLDFTRRKINYIECTNVLAQGLNFPCENMEIEYNPYDGDEIILQKLGRLGRPGITPDTARLTYCSVDVPEKLEKQRTPRYVRQSFDIDKDDIRYPYLASFIGEPVHTVPKVRKYDEYDVFSLNYTKYSIQNVGRMIDKFGDEIRNFAKVKEDYQEYLAVGSRVKGIIENEWATVNSTP
jgi:superfamily II DNA or RNA helicase